MLHNDGVNFIAYFKNIVNKFLSKAFGDQKMVKRLYQRCIGFLQYCKCLSISVTTNGPGLFFVIKNNQAPITDEKKYSTYLIVNYTTKNDPFKVHI